MNANEPIDQALRLTRIIVGGMMTGVLGLSVVAIFIGQQAEPDPKLANILLAVLAVCAVAYLIAYMCRASIVGWLRHAAQSSPPADPLTERIRIFNSRIIVGCALAEGLGLFGAVIMLITGAWAALAAPALALILLAWQLPSRDKIVQFVSGETGQQWSEM